MFECELVPRLLEEGTVPASGLFLGGSPVTSKTHETVQFELQRVLSATTRVYVGYTDAFETALSRVATVYQ